MKRVLSVSIICILFHSGISAQDSVYDLRRQLIETQRQREENRRWMLIHATESIDSFGRASASQGKLGLGLKIQRLLEIKTALEAANQKDNAREAARLISEGGLIIGAVGLSTAIELAGLVAYAFNMATNVPLTAGVAYQNWSLFLDRARDDRRLLARESELRNRLEVAARQQTSTTVNVPERASPPLESFTDENLETWNDVLTLLRFEETKDWTIEEKQNVQRIAAKYPEIEIEYSLANARLSMSSCPGSPADNILLTIERIRDWQSNLRQAQDYQRLYNWDMKQMLEYAPKAIADARRDLATYVKTCEREAAKRR